MLCFLYLYKLSHNSYNCVFQMCCQRARERGEVGSQTSNMFLIRKPDESCWIGSTVLSDFMQGNFYTRVSFKDSRNEWFSSGTKGNLPVIAKRKSVSQLSQWLTMTSPSSSPHQRKAAELKWLVNNGSLGEENETLPSMQGGRGEQRRQIDRRAAQELIMSAVEPNQPLPGSLPASKAF